MNWKSLDEDVRLLLDSVSLFRVPSSQPGVECYAISMYSCISFQSFVLDLYQKCLDGKMREEQIRELDIRNFASSDSFFINAIRHGVMIWSIVVSLRQFTSYEATRMMMEKELRKSGASRGVGAIQEDSSTWTPQLIEDLQTRVQHTLEPQKERREKLSAAQAVTLQVDFPLGVDLMNVIQQQPDFPPRDASVYLNADEIFQNIPGLCWLDASEKMKVYHIMALSMGTEGYLEYSLESVLRRMAQVKSLGDIARKYQQIGEVLHKYERENIAGLGDDVKIDLATMIYAAETYLTEEGVREYQKLVPKNARETEMDSTHSYSIVEFIESLLHSNSAPETSYPAHLRCFVFTRNGASFSVFCNTAMETFAFFDSHPSSISPGTSTVYHAGNRFGFFGLLNRLFKTNSLRVVYIDIVELRLTIDDFHTIAEKCRPFQQLECA